MSQASRSPEIAKRAEEIDHQGHVRDLSPQHHGGDGYWEQGTAAFRNEIRLEDCPFAPGIEQDDWLRGWMAAELAEFGVFESDA